MTNKRQDGHGYDLIAVVGIGLEDPKNRKISINFARWKQFARAWSMVLENAASLLCGEA